MSHHSSEFFRFPSTPHVAWLSGGTPRDDKLLSAAQSHELLASEVVVEEKLDGANMGISDAPDGSIRAQNRGQYVTPPFTGQFQPLGRWLAQHEDGLFEALGENLTLFGEWCAARHSVAYDRLSDWFLAFDVYDREADRFWGSGRRDALVRRVGLSIVPRLFRGRASLAELRALVQSATSQFYAGPVEGVVIRKESPEWLVARAKLVRPDFVQHIGQHWQRRAIEWNRLRVPSPAGRSIERRP
jgi:ATP-dependent RNA circularization protein (DNA/RNA ligase family)